MNATAFCRAVSLIALGLTGCLGIGRAADSGAATRNANETVAPAAMVYVDCNLGQDANPGTKESPVRSISRAAEIISSRDNAIYVMRLNPGIHVLAKHVVLGTEKDMAGRRIIVEACTLPDDPAWTPEKMPIVINSSDRGELGADVFSYVVSFLVEESHVTIRGLKFHGYSRPNSRYFPVARFNKAKTDLQVEQCLFVGDPQAAHLQVGIIAHGNGIKIDHCIFYNARNPVVFWEDAGDGIKSGNSFTHSIIVGASQGAVWTAWPDQDFVFQHNIVTGCKYVWIKNAPNTSTYSMDDCIVVDNQHETGVPREDGVRPEPFDLRENNVVKAGKITLRLVDDLDQPLPRDYLHPLPGTLGHNMDAGLFRK